MCGRLACTLNCSEISKNCKYKNKANELEEPKWIESCFEYEPTYNGPPSTVVAVLAHKNNFSDITKSYPDYCLISMKWGMIPSFKTETTGNFHTHNARIENVLKSSMYKPCLTSGKRCIVLADGYYEWQTTQGEGNKQPYFLYQKPQSDEESKNPYLMKFAGLFNITRHDSVIKYTCTILTTESDKSFSWMHHRMPIILNTDEDVFNWLNYEDVKYEEALKKLPKYDQFDKKFELKYHAVNKTYVNSTSCNDKKCLERISLKRKSVSTLDGWLKKKN